MTNKIENIKARQIFDSRGNPTIEVDIFSKNNFARASIPSGASTGKYEAIELRDGGNSLMGKGVSKVIDIIENKLKNQIIGMSVFDQEEIDFKMCQLDGTDNKSLFGANSILPISLAVARLASQIKEIELFEYLSTFCKSNQSVTTPIPLMNILNGGSHADNLVDVQEFMIAPTSARTFKEALIMGVEVFHNLKGVLKSKGFSTNVGDEGGFAPNLKTNEEALDLILLAIEKSGYKAGEDIYLAIDAASSEFYKNNNYCFNNGDILSSSEMVGFWKNWTNKYPIFSIEDGLHEDDWDGWINLTEQIGEKVQLVGDDLFVTNIKRLKKGVSNKASNSILIKPNQIGTLSETFNTMTFAKENNFTTIMSHRSGETEDTFISDLAVAFRCSQIKTGSCSRTDRVAKYNQLLRIEEKLVKNTFFSVEKLKYCK
ncbi:MAG: phosphopyruvate hydratase [Flavobacteriales bacterium]|nr:phosphopyruvate hydratase [Flavobacteriales bacterium]|tara:strand:- start:794 stop:2080 length:1287 start_codon:yes stop_codon:yes gene_type:complete